MALPTLLLLALPLLLCKVEVQKEVPLLLNNLTEVWLQRKSPP